MKKPLKTVEFFLERYNLTTNSSLNRSIQNSDGEAGQVMDFVASGPNYCMDMDARGEKLARILRIVMSAAGLNEAEQALVLGRHCHGEHPRSYAEIAREHGLNPSWARNQYLRVMKRLEDAAQSSGMTMTRILEKA